MWIKYYQCVRYTCIFIIIWSNMDKFIRSFSWHDLIPSRPDKIFQDPEFFPFTSYPLLPHTSHPNRLPLWLDVCLYIASNDSDNSCLSSLGLNHAAYEQNLVNITHELISKKQTEAMFCLLIGIFKIIVWYWITFQENVSVHI